MDIVGPDVEGTPHADLSFQPAAQYEPLMDAVYEVCAVVWCAAGICHLPFSQYAAHQPSFVATRHGCLSVQELAAGVAQIGGSSVEHNKFCVSVHFRNCDPDDYPAGAQQGCRVTLDAGLCCHTADAMQWLIITSLMVLSSHAVVGVVEAVAAAHPELRVTRGRKVLEVRPQVRPAPGCGGGVPASQVCRSAFNFEQVHSSQPTLPFLPVPGGLGQGHGAGALVGAARASRP